MPIKVGGYEFRNQFVVASGPTVKNLEMVQKIEAAGWGAASLKLAIDPTYISIPAKRTAGLKNKNTMPLPPRPAWGSRRGCA
jgi:dihydroorotate dehydrogenase